MATILVSEMKKMISRIDHVSIAVNDIDRAHDFFKKMAGVVAGASAIDNHMEFEWEIFSAGDLSRLELMHPTGPNSFLTNFLSDKEGGVHHITFETPDIQKTKSKLDEYRIPYFGFNDSDETWKELFIHPKDAFGVLIQIAQFRPEQWIHPSENLPKGQKWSVENAGDRTQLTVAHPGGGKVKLSLDRSEVNRLIQDLKQVG
jgi:methylmalonyl-CoA/ethylmalonyl-CoA epimerase